MMQRKSKQRALELSAVTVLSFSATGAILNILLPYWLSGDIRTVVANPESLAQPGSLLVLLLFLVIILGVMVALGAFWLYRFFGEAHFGERAPLRWALIGVLFAIFLKLPDWLLPAGWGILRGVLQLSGLLAAYFLARWLVPLRWNTN
jgi:hypothetical protein